MSCLKAYCIDGSEPPLTTFKIRDSEKCCTIDYIFHSPNLPVSAILDIPKKIDFGPVGLPCEVYPSDHIALYAQFVVK